MASDRSFITKNFYQGAETENVSFKQIFLRKPR